MFCRRQKLKIIQYRNYKTFSEQLFRIELAKDFANFDLNNAELAEFYNEFLSMLNKRAPVKYKYIRANNCSYMTKNLRKEICLVLDHTISFLRWKQKNLSNYTTSNEIFVLLFYVKPKEITSLICHLFQLTKNVWASIYFVYYYFQQKHELYCSRKNL